MDRTLSQEEVLKLAAENRGQCRACKRVGPLNGAFTSWWAGVPILVLCPECFTVGRGVVMRRNAQGMELRMLEDDRAPELVVVPNLRAGFDALRAQRAPSKGW